MRSFTYSRNESQLGTLAERSRRMTGGSCDPMALDMKLEGVAPRDGILLHNKNTSTARVSLRTQGPLCAQPTLYVLIVAQPCKHVGCESVFIHTTVVCSRPSTSARACSSATGVS